jgi:hypothetical protein
MNGVESAPNGRNGIRALPDPVPRRIRNRALLLMALALAFYFGFIAITFYRSHH